MSERDFSIVVSPGRVSLDDLQQVIAGASAVLDPSFWARVEAASAIVAKAAHNEIVTLVSKSNDQWWLIRTNSGAEGYAYAQYLSPQ